MTPPRNRQAEEFTEGLLEAVGIALVMAIPLITLPFLWGLQLLYVIPRAIFLYRGGRRERIKGVLTGAVIVALVNGGCWLLLLNP